MKTEQLVRALAMDGARPIVPLVRTLATALLIGTLLSAGVLGAALHPRADIGAAMRTFSFLFKLIVALTLAGSAVAVLTEVGLPTPSTRWTRGLVLAPLLLIIGVIAELYLTPRQAWSARLVGHNAAHCLSLIPLLSAAPAICVLAALRHGAPARPAFAGAIAGLVSGAIGAVLYALTCPDDSPLFVITWYSIAVAMVTAASACAGSRALRW